MRVRTLFITALAAALALLWALPAAASKEDNTIAVAFYDRFDTLENYQSSQRANIQLGYLIFDALVLRDPDTGEILPHVATEWEARDDTTWYFKLQDGIRFHNGNPLTAEAIEYTVEERILNEDLNSPQFGNFSWIDDVEVLNDTELLIHTDGPYALALERLNTLFIMDPVSSRQRSFEEIQQEPIGSGPFRFVEWNKGRNILLERNRDYWKEGIPKVGGMNFKIIPEASTRVAELFSGGADVAMNLTVDQEADFRGRDEFVFYQFPIIRINFWSLDAMGRAGDSPLTDVRVRRAMAHAINKETIVKDLLGGKVYEVNVPTSRYQFGYCGEEVEWYEYDPERARELLAEAGYPNGFELDLWEYADEQHLPNQAAMQMLSDVGIEVNLHDYRGNTGQMTRLRRAGDITGVGNFTWGSYNVFDADAIMYAWFHSESSNNYYGDEELSQWLQEARDTVDRERRQELYCRAQERVVNQVYWIPLFGVTRQYGHHVDLDFRAGVDEVPRFWTSSWK